MKRRSNLLNVAFMMVLAICFSIGCFGKINAQASTLKFEKSKYTANQGNIIDLNLLLDNKDLYEELYWDWYNPVQVESSDHSVAVLTGSGTQLKCLNEGKVVITAKYNGMTAKCSVTVKANKLKLNKKNVSVYTGEEIKFTLKGSKKPARQYTEVYDTNYNMVYSSAFDVSMNNDDESFVLTPKLEGEYYVSLVRENDDGVRYSKMVHITVEKCGPVKDKFSVAVGKTADIELENAKLVSMEITYWVDSNGYSHWNNDSYNWYYYGDNAGTEDSIITTVHENYYGDYFDDYSDWYSQQLIDIQYEGEWVYYCYKEAGKYFCIMENYFTGEYYTLDDVTWENGGLVTKYPEDYDPYLNPTPTPEPTATPYPTWSPEPTWTPEPTYAPYPTATPVVTQPVVKNDDYPVKIDEKKMTIKGLYEGNANIKVTYKTPKGDLASMNITVYVTDPKYVPFNDYLWTNDSYRINYSNASSYSEITVKSSDKSIVEVDEYNNIVPKKAGSCKLTITIDGVKFTEKVDVINVKINTGSLILAKGQSETRKVTGLPDGMKVTYSTSDKNIATVSKAGKITANKKNYGVAIITINVGERAFKFAVTVGEKLGVNAARAAGEKVGKAIYSQEKRMQEGYYDCSSLVWRSYKEAGVCMKDNNYAPTAADLAKFFEEKGCALDASTVTYKDLLPGDLLFTAGGNNGRYKNINHVAMYYGAEYSDSSWWWGGNDDDYYGLLVEAGSGGVRFSGYDYGGVVIVRPGKIYK